MWTDILEKNSMSINGNLNVNEINSKKVCESEFLMPTRNSAVMYRNEY